MRLVNIWAKSPSGTWSCAANMRQLVNGDSTAEPLGKRFQSAAGTQIYYPVLALVETIPLSFEVHGDTALSKLMSVLRCGVLYLDGAVYPAQAGAIVPFDQHLGDCLILSGNVSVTTISVSREIYRVSFSAIRQLGQEEFGEIPYFCPAFQRWQYFFFRCGNRTGQQGHSLFAAGIFAVQKRQTSGRRLCATAGLYDRKHRRNLSAFLCWCKFAASGFAKNFDIRCQRVSKCGERSDGVFSRFQRKLDSAAVDWDRDHRSSDKCLCADAVRRY